MHIYAVYRDNVSLYSERRTRIYVPDAVETSSDHLLEDVKPELTDRKAEGVEFARTDRYNTVSVDRMWISDSTDSLKEKPLVMNP